AFDLTVDAHTSFDLGASGDAVIAGSLHLAGTSGLPLEVDGRLDFLGKDVEFTGAVAFTDNEWKLSLDSTAASSATFTLDATFDPSANHLTGTVTASNVGVGSLSIADSALSFDVAPGAAAVTLESGTLTVDGIAVVLTGTLTANDGTVEYHLTG